MRCTRETRPWMPFQRTLSRTVNMMKKIPQIEIFIITIKRHPLIGFFGEDLQHCGILSSGIDAYVQPFFRRIGFWPPLAASGEKALVVEFVDESQSYAPGMQMIARPDHGGIGFGDRLTDHRRFCVGEELTTAIFRPIGYRFIRPMFHTFLNQRSKEEVQARLVDTTATNGWRT